MIEHPQFNIQQLAYEVDIALRYLSNHFYPGAAFQNTKELLVALNAHPLFQHIRHKDPDAV